MLRATCIGNLGNDPELRYSANDTAFLRFNLASNYRVRTPEGEWEDRTEWVRVTVFGQRAETLSQYLKKGMRVYVEGRLEARPWTDQQGGLRSGLEVTAQDVEFLSPRQQDDAPASARPSATNERPNAGYGAQGQDDDLDDLPF